MFMGKKKSEGKKSIHFHYRKTINLFKKRWVEIKFDASLDGKYLK